MQYDLESGDILTVANDPLYDPQSADNVHCYDEVQTLGDVSTFGADIKLGIRLERTDGSSRSCILFADCSYGAPAVKPTQIVIVGQTLHIALGDFVVAIDLADLSRLWMVHVLTGACFGIYHSSTYDCIIAHGDPSITRIALNGMICWTVVVAETLTDTFVMSADSITVQDWDGVEHRLDIESGTEIGA